MFWTSNCITRNGTQQQNKIQSITNGRYIYSLFISPNFLSNFHFLTFHASQILIPFSVFLHALQEPCFMMHSSLIFVTLGTKLISRGHVS